MSKTDPPTEDDVDELLQDGREDDRRPAAKAEGPEQALQVGLVDGEERQVRAVSAPHAEAAAVLGREHVAALDLLDHAGGDVAHRRRRRWRHRGNAHARHLEPCGRRPRAVDRVDDEDQLGVGRSHQAAVLGVVGPARQAARHVRGQVPLRLLVDTEGHVTADGDPGVSTRRVHSHGGQDDSAQRRAQTFELQDDVAHGHPRVVGRDRRRRSAGAVDSTLLYSHSWRGRGTRASRPLLRG